MVVQMHAWRRIHFWHQSSLPPILKMIVSCLYSAWRSIKPKMGVKEDEGRTECDVQINSIFVQCPQKIKEIIQGDFT